MNSSNHLATDSLQIYIAANFTAEPIEEFLAFWMSELEIRADIRFASYNQVFQQLLDGGLLYSNSGGINLVALDLDSWFISGPTVLAHAQLDRTVEDFISTLRIASSHGAGGAVLLFPSENPADQFHERSRAVNAAKTSIAAACENIAGWTSLDIQDAVPLYSVSKIHDPFTKELGDIPYTEEMYAAAATMVARWIRASYSKPRKVIALDCDNTLWQGVYGEGSMVVTPPYRKLHEFMLRQLDSGMLLVLTSKNNEDDVMAALDTDNCLLRPEHFAAWQINWSPKSENLKALANDLGLALDSFIFVDDSSYECMEVRNSCPDVLTIQLPSDPDTIPGFLEHLWVFDRQAATAEDQKRTSMYLAERQRTELSKSALTVEEFLDSLCIKIQFARATESELSRVAQLTQRTTQFNVTGLLHSEQTLLSSLSLGNHYCWTVRVQDVFGDYGLVGVLLFEIQDHALRVEVFLLSCRALGRGVEDQMIEKLKGCAVELGVDRVIIPVVPTSRNRPALEFLSKRYHTPLDSKNPFECSLSVLDDTTQWRPVEASVTDNQIKPTATKKYSHSTNKQGFLLRVATQMQSGAAVVSVVRGQRRLRSDLASSLVAPRSDIEMALVDLWAEALGIEPVGVEDNFFELGGTSLIAARILTRVLADFGISLNFHTMFETPTVAGLASAISHELSTKS